MILLLNTREKKLMKTVKTIEKKKIKSPKNKTIDFETQEGEIYLREVVSVSEQVEVEKILDKSILGDTFDVLSKLPNKFVDLLIVDPPYNLTKNYHGKQFDKQSKQEYYTFTKKWIESILHLLKENASIYVCCDWESSLIIGSVLKEYFYVQNRITWQREKGRGAKSNWKNAMEDIWFATKSKKYTFNVEMVKVRKKVIAPYRIEGKPKDWDETKEGNFRNSYPSNFWDDISIPYWSMPENTAHPTQKPEKLIAKLILASTNQGDVVLDPFVGSGTTSVVAKKLNRHYVGIDLNQQYLAWAEYRLKKAEKNRTIQGYTGGVFWERNTLSEQQKVGSENTNISLLEEEK